MQAPGNTNPPKPGSALRVFVVALIFIAVARVFSISQHGSAPDDVYITWRYARNLAEGHGLVYNLGQRYLGTSGPGYALILALLARFFGVAQIPNLSANIAAISLVFLAIGLFKIFDDREQPVLGFIAGLLAMTLPPIRQAFCFEVLPQLACVVWAYHFFLKSSDQRKTATISAVLLGVAILIRPDGVLWLIPPLAYAIFRALKSARAKQGWLSELPIKEIGIGLAILAPFLLASWIYYGHPLPNTYAAKVAQRESIWTTYADGGIEWLLQDQVSSDSYYAGVLAFAFAGFALLFYAIATERNRALALLMFGVLLHAILYGIKLPYYTWYFAPEGLGMALLAALAIDFLYRRIARRPILRYAAVAVLLILGFEYVRQENTMARAEHDSMLANVKIRTYNAFGDWLQTNTQPSDSIGLCEVGIIGWVSDRPIVDQFYLVNPGDVDSIARKSFYHAFLQYQPKIIACSPQLFGTFEGNNWFHQRYEYWTSFPDHLPTPFTIKEGEEFTKNNRLEIELWRRRDHDLDIASARALAASVRQKLQQENGN